MRIGRSLATLVAATLVVTLASEPSFAQSAAPATGPAGGVPSTTAPSNSQGTPAGGTGTLSTTQVGPSTAAPAPATRSTRHPTRHRARHHRATPAPAPSAN